MLFKYRKKDNEPNLLLKSLRTLRPNEITFGNTNRHYLSNRLLKTSFCTLAFYYVILICIPLCENLDEPLI
ncbi:hypothetical protein C5749_15355 [Sphingobacterium gobiense]|uniref:Uncharacterized protein n=1 Tax=Sphingobacterium gobiense TaxID=1382456 RepID=A0A2S9JHZ8_9SPHI|nr:hypothetical protein C5749_15355 [Sphingobacterium gobiense]